MFGSCCHKESVELDGVSNKRDQTDSLATGLQMVPEGRYLIPPITWQLWILGDSKFAESAEAGEPVLDGIANAVVGVEYWVNRTSAWTRGILLVFLKVQELTYQYVIRVAISTNTVNCVFSSE